MTIGYYPGCSLTGTGKEFDISLRCVLNKLDVEPVEVQDWSCCGATSAHATNHLLSIALPARNLLLASKQNLSELLAPCAACYNRLVVCQHEVNANPLLQKQVENVIGEKFTNKIDVINIIEVFKKIGIDKISQNKIADLKGLKAACYYGCLLVRPFEILHFDDAEEPDSMEEIVSATGAKTVDWNFKTECCGGAHSIACKDIVVSLSKKIIDDARLHGANVIVVGCPMCHSNLDMRQIAIKREFPDHENIPILYLSELVGLSLGLEPRQLGIDLHLVNADSLIVKAVHAE